MLYTGGIRKIFSKVDYGNLEALCKAAEAAGYHAALHNGSVYVRSADIIAQRHPTAWILSPFEIEDFEAGGASS